MSLPFNRKTHTPPEMVYNLEVCQSESSWTFVRVHPRLGAYELSGCLQSSDGSMREHSRGMGPC